MKVKSIGTVTIQGTEEDLSKPLAEPALEKWRSAGSNRHRDRQSESKQDLVYRNKRGKVE